MSTNFQIFATQAELDTKDTAIDGLCEYPNAAIKTDTYRNGFQKYQGTDWAGAVNDGLVTACSEMTPEQRLVYFPIF